MKYLGQIHSTNACEIRLKTSLFLVAGYARLRVDNGVRQCQGYVFTFDFITRPRASPARTTGVLEFFDFQGRREARKKANTNVREYDIIPSLGSPKRHLSLPKTFLRRQGH